MVEPVWHGEQASLALRLLEVAAWVTDTPDPDGVLRRAAEGLYGVLSAHSAVAYLYHPRERALELRAAVGAAPRVRPYVPIRTQGITSRLLRALGPLAVPDCSQDPSVKAELLAAGVRAFVGLPLLRDRLVRAVVYVNFARPQGFPPEVLALLGAFARQVSAALDRAEAHRALRVTRDRMILSLAEAVDARDHPTGGHSRRIQAVARAVGQALGLGRDQLESLETAALLHDIGKIGVRDAVLLKPGRLSREERRAGRWSSTPSSGRASWPRRGCRRRWWRRSATPTSGTTAPVTPLASPENRFPCWPGSWRWRTPSKP